jgi:hypothetical protein
MTLSNKVLELEQKLLIVRGLYLSTHAAVASLGFPFLWGNNASSKLLDVSLPLLPFNTGVGASTVQFAFSSSKPTPCVLESAANTPIVSNIPQYQVSISMSEKKYNVDSQELQFDHASLRPSTV